MLPRLLSWIVALAVNSPGRVVAFWLCATVLAGVFAAIALRVDTGTSTFLDRSGPPWATYQAAVRAFGGDEYIAVSLEGRQPYDWDLLARLPDLSRKIEKLPGVRRVDSLATVALIRSAAGGEILTQGAVEDGIPTEESARRKLVAAIQEDLIAPRFLISADGRHIALNVMLDRNLDADRAQTVQRVRAILDGEHAILAGVPIFRTEVNYRTQLEVGLFIPATFLLIAIIVYLWVRSVAGIIAMLAVGGAGAAITLAALAATNVPLSLSTMLLPSVLTAVGCAYVGHMLVATAREPASAGYERAAEVVPGIVWSGVTTAIGFAAMSTTSVDSIRQLAAYGSLGVFVVTAAAISLVPAALTLGRELPRQTGIAKASGQLCLVLAQGAIRHRRAVIVAWVGVSAAVALGARGLSVDTNIIEWFGKSDPIRVAYERIRQDFAGITPVSVVIRSVGDRRVTEPAVLRAIESLRQDLEKKREVGRVLAVTQALEMARRAFGRSGLPESQAEAEQYLLLLDSEDEITDVITPDRRAANLWLRLDQNDSQEILGIAPWVDAWWSKHGTEGFAPKTTGVMFEFARAQDAIASTQLRGLGIAVGAVGLVLCLALGSLRKALIAMVPNGLPIALAFGGMGLLHIPLDAATVCLGSLALGIAVDDTVHVMLTVAKMRDGSRETVAPAWALQLQPVFPALVLTTACVSIGFGVLGFSSFVLVRNLGVITAVVVSICLMADLTLLPALLGGEPSAGSVRARS